MPANKGKIDPGRFFLPLLPLLLLFACAREPAPRNANEAAKWEYSWANPISSDRNEIDWDNLETKANWTVFNPKDPFTRPEGKSVLWMRMPLPSNGDGDMALFLRYAIMNVKLYVDRKLTYDHAAFWGASRFAWEGATAGHNKYILASLPSAPDRYIYLRFESERRRIGPVGQPEVGNRFEIYSRLIQAEADRLVVGVVLLFAAIAGSILFMFTRRFEFAGFAIFLVSSGLYVLSRCAINDYLIADPGIWSRIELPALYVLPAGYAMFIYHTISRDLVHKLIMIGSFALFAISIFLLLIGGHPLALLPTYQISAIVAIVASLVSIARALGPRDVRGRVFMIGLFLAFATNAHDIASAALGRSLFPGPISHWGFLAILVALAIILGLAFVDSARALKKLTEELAKRNDALKLIDKLKDEFLANTSHELRTPLHGMIGLADSLIEGATGPLSEATKRNLGLIVASGKRLTSLINDILDFSKLKSRDIELALRPVDVRSLVEVVLAVSKPLLATKQLELQSEIPDNLPAAHADENRLQQILHNLIGNAIKFTPSGKVTVSARSLEKEIEITISDTGIGIPMEKQSDIFKSFEQADASVEREYGGTGLGLSITKQLVELHGGRIRVESEPMKGSRFTFSLPSTNDAVGAERLSTIHILGDRAMATNGLVPAIPESIHKSPEASGPLILVVDDEPVNRQVLSNILSVHNYRVIEAGSGAEALDLVDNHLPDTVLLDVMMPRMNGYDVCRKIRKTYSRAELPVIFLSAKNQVEDLVTGMESGGNDYLPKPFSTPELLARVNTQANLKANYNESIQLRGKLLSQEKMATVGSMAAGIVHDFKNPVGIIMGFAELADDDSVGRAERSEYLRIIGQEANRLASMAQDVLDYARGSVTTEKTSVDLGEYLIRAEKSLRPYFTEKGIQFGIRRECDGQISIDTDRFLRVLINIAGNAADALGPEGSFEIIVRHDGKRFKFELRDNGPGIPESIRAALFDPFVTHGKSHGTGLGMAIAKSIVEAHGGTIRFETETGKGTTFFLEIP
ncbi:MAG: response regulator [Leptospirales bacterium]|nr:response regulator [Leptospirales bacterium]